MADQHTAQTRQHGRSSGWSDRHGHHPWRAHTGRPGVHEEHRKEPGCEQSADEAHAGCRDHLTRANAQERLGQDRGKAGNARRNVSTAKARATERQSGLTTPVPKQTVCNDQNYTPRGADNVLSLRDTYQPAEPGKTGWKGACNSCQGNQGSNVLASERREH